MKQDLNTPVSELKTEKKKKEVNLYEPYSTPPVIYHILRYIVLALLAVFARIHVRGRYNIPRKGPYIIAANHIYWTDIPIIPAYLSEKVVFMAKEKWFRGKLAWLVRFLGAFPVKPEEADRQAIRAAGDQLKQGKIFFIFPEGTRSKTLTMQKAYGGLGMIALRAGVPVLPVATWGGEKVLKKFGAPVTVSFGEPMIFKPKGKKMTREDIEEVTETIMYKIAEMLPAQYRGVYSELPTQDK